MCILSIFLQQEGLLSLASSCGSCPRSHSVQCLWGVGEERTLLDGKVQGRLDFKSDSKKNSSVSWEVSSVS